MPTKKGKNGRLAYVDTQCGALAALAAGVARSLGRTDVVAATESPAVSVPHEVRAVLDEIGAPTPEVVLASGLPPATERIALGVPGPGHDEPLLVLHQGDGQGEGELERMALARIARDRIEQRLELGLPLGRARG